MENNFRIDFIGIGAAKSGTTWLADALRQHPDIFIPEKKELRYFYKTELHTQIPNYRYEKPISWYHSFFKQADPDKVKGEISPHYFVASDAVENIYRYNQNIKIIAALRNPVERLVSDYNYWIQIGKIPPMPFSEVIDKYPIILKHGLYFENLSRYYEKFSHSNIKIVLFDDLKSNAISLYSEILNFLNVKESIPDLLHKKVNKTRQNRIPMLNYLIELSRRFIYKNNLLFLRPVLRNTGISPLAEFIRDHLNTTAIDRQKFRLNSDNYSMLHDCYSDDVCRLEKLIDRDLSTWKRVQ